MNKKLSLAHSKCDNSQIKNAWDSLARLNWHKTRRLTTFIALVRCSLGTMIRFVFPTTNPPPPPPPGVCWLKTTSPDKVDVNAYVNLVGHLSHANAMQTVSRLCAKRGQHVCTKNQNIVQTKARGENTPARPPCNARFACPSQRRTH